jgi:hypothetical protein
MKKCTYCGKEYSDDATACVVDEQPLERIDPQGATQHGSDTSPFKDPGLNSPGRAAANRNMLVGGLWCVGGIVVSVATYSAASSGGGSYVVAWGAIIFGGIQFFRGLLARQDDGRN